VRGVVYNKFVTSRAALTRATNRSKIWKAVCLDLLCARRYRISPGQLGLFEFWQRKWVCR